MERKLFTSESVSEGHPDKVCDKISDSILDACLEQDEFSHVACETFITGNDLILAGEITTNAIVDYEAIAKNVLKEIGYDDLLRLGTDYHSIKIINLVKGQSQDINNAVGTKDILNLKAGDQGIMFGYATNETEGYMPLAISIAHKLVRRASLLRKSGEFKNSKPDMKSQVTIDYTNKTPRIDTILMSCSHDDNIDMNQFISYIKNNIILDVVKSFGLNTDFRMLINPSGKFVISGPLGDTGLTGRKIIVDTYGGSAAHGGGCFSGKDPTKVDRTAAYMARYIAKNLVAAGASEKMEVQLSYGIGIANPISISINCFGTSKYSESDLIKIVNKVFDCKVGSIISNFSLTKPSFKYSDISNYGHFGRPDIETPWEKLDKVNDCKVLLALLK